jgi:hypothetical protein
MRDAREDVALDGLGPAPDEGDGQVEGFRNPDQSVSDVVPHLRIEHVRATTRILRSRGTSRRG